MSKRAMWESFPEHVRQDVHLHLQAKGLTHAQMCGEARSRGFDALANDHNTYTEAVAVALALLGYEQPRVLVRPQ